MLSVFLVLKVLQTVIIMSTNRLLTLARAAPGPCATPGPPSGPASASHCLICKTSCSIPLEVSKAKITISNTSDT